MTDVLFKTKTGVSKSWVRNVVERVLRAEKTRADMDVLITDNHEIRRMNKRFLNHDTATDVISFDLAGGQARLQGSIAVSSEFAKRYARAHAVPYREELARYLVHGTLHLLGYDDKKGKDRDRMHKKQEALLKKIL